MRSDFGANSLWFGVFPASKLNLAGKSNLHSSQTPSRDLWSWSNALSGVDKLPEEPAISQDPSFLVIFLNNSQTADTGICLPVTSPRLFGSLSHRQSCRFHCRTGAASRASRWMVWRRTHLSWNSPANLDLALRIVPPSQRVHLYLREPEYIERNVTYSDTSSFIFPVSTIVILEKKKKSLMQRWKEKAIQVFQLNVLCKVALIAYLTKS